MSRRFSPALIVPVFAWAVLTVLAPPKAARGEVLWEGPLSLGFTTGMPVVGPAELQWGFFARADHFVPPPSMTPSPGSVFDALRLTPDTVGQTFRLLPGDDPDFASLEGLLTDGSKGWLYEQTHYRDLGRPAAERYLGRMTSGLLEDDWFGHAPGGPVDLAGYDIAAFTLRHESLALVNQGSSSRITGSVTLSIEGTAVPEPAGLALGLVGAAWSVLKRRR